MMMLRMTKKLFAMKVKMGVNSRKRISVILEDGLRITFSIIFMESQTSQNQELIMMILFLRGISSLTLQSSGILLIAQFKKL